MQPPAGSMLMALAAAVCLVASSLAFHVASPMAMAARRSAWGPAAASRWALRPDAKRIRMWSVAGKAQQGEAEAPAEEAAEAPEGAEVEAVAPDPAAELKKTVADLESSVFAMERRLSVAKENVREKGKTGFLRLAAEVDNYRKRRAADKSGLECMALAEVVKAFVPVLDAFEQAKAELAQQPDEVKKFGGSYSALESQLREVLGKLGMTPFFAAQSEVFNAARHEAVEKRHSDDYPKGQVIECWSQGLEVKGAVASKVKCVVSLGKEGEAAEPAVSEETAAEAVNTEADAGDDEVEADGAAAKE